MYNKHEKNQRYTTYCRPMVQCSIWSACMQHALLTIRYLRDDVKNDVIVYLHKLKFS